MGISSIYYLTILIILLTISSNCFGRHKHFHSRVPIIDLNGAEELIGTIREDEHIVSVSPQLRILHGTGPICRYELNWFDETLKEPIPFEVKILDASEGLAQIRRLTSPSTTFIPLDCAHRSDYYLRLEAVKCGDEPTKSEITKLRIIIQDVNNHSPEFDAPWYSFDIDEGREAPFEIARLLATDLDCGHPYGKICRYELTNTLSDNPFRIDDRGVLSTIKPLNRSQAQSHILTVIAEDCGMRRSKSVLVTVNIRARCIDSINSKMTKINLIQGNEPKYLIPDAEINICDNLNEKCQIETEIKLLNNLKLNTINNKEFNECGMNEGGIVILSDEEETIIKNKTKNEKINNDDDEEEEEDEEEDINENKEEKEIEFKINKENKNNYFDGKRSIDIIESRLPQTIPEKFSLVFSMKTDPGTEEQQRLKQNILCESDYNGLNRHHFAVYLRHCKLELLLRREPEDASAEFRAAEWRWNDERICDGNWHSYGLLFNDLDNVQLTIDGKLFNTTQRNPEILDDWPLHQIKDKKTRLVVGACWHGRQKQMVQHFTGHLSSMRIWINQVQSIETINCIHGKHEHLILNKLNNEKNNIQSSSLINLNAQSTTEMENLLHLIQFSIDPLFIGNTKISPSIHPGQRQIQISGTLKCSNNITKPLNSINIFVDVSKGHFTPQLIITGRHIVFADKQNLRNGAPLLPDVKINVNEGSLDVTSSHKLSWCRVHMRPARDMDLELFSSPTLLLEKLQLQFVHDKQGFILRGSESPSSYAEVLEHIRYFNLRPESFPHRSYTLQCEMLDSKILSNELFTTMSIDTSAVNNNNKNNELDEAVEKLVQISDKLDKDILPRDNKGNRENNINEEESSVMKHHLGVPSYDQLGANRLQNILEMDLPRAKAIHGYEQGAVAGGAVAVVVVICVGILLVLLVIGVLRMRDQPLTTKRRRSRRDSMMEWDDSGLMNITINPLEEIGGKQLSADGLDYEDDEDDEDDDEDDSGSEDGGEGYRGVEPSDDEAGDDEKLVLPHADEGSRKGVGLEWDDSTLDGPSSPGPSNSQRHIKNGAHRV